MWSFFSPSTLVLLLSLVSVQAFLVIPKPYEHLANVAESLQRTKHLDINLHVNDNSRSQDKAGFSLQGLTVGFGNSVGSKSFKMPGASGFNPSISSGINELTIENQASFIDISGTQLVKMNNACWEIVWRDGDMAGSIICAFDMPVEAKRNGAILPKGRIYMTFPVWTHEGLATQQARKIDVEKRAMGYLGERDEELQKMQETSNPISKVWHYRNAAEAFEKYYITGYSTLKNLIPDQGDIIEMADGLLLTKKGTIWRNGDSKKVILGTAQISEPKKE